MNNIKPSLFANVLNQLKFIINKVQQSTPVQMLYREAIKVYIWYNAKLSKRLCLIIYSQLMYFEIRLSRNMLDPNDQKKKKLKGEENKTL